ncbi:hypothetical protein GCM10012286_21170 [Streptomyces lasiicapitis]|uniref:Secreted protein n=1 Tax=Streptomyces lasiicapitis TaxID=1923961 RepID=A0ABQ2LP72_9ACTN|nr:hypothetical protein GCM10012286_21170 [Streptomyces lasiicapitis]
MQITATVWVPGLTFCQEAVVPVSCTCRPEAKLALPLLISDPLPPPGHAVVVTVTVEPLAVTVIPVAATADGAASASGSATAATARPERRDI